LLGSIRTYRGYGAFGFVDASVIPDLFVDVVHGCCAIFYSVNLDAERWCFPLPGIFNNREVGEFPDCWL
jgi:hypothetical protein